MTIFFFFLENVKFLGERKGKGNNEKIQTDGYSWDCFDNFVHFLDQRTLLGTKRWRLTTNIEYGKMKEEMINQIKMIMF